jgi:hypothetical protein
MPEANERAAGTLRRSEPWLERPRAGGGFADRRSTESALAATTNMGAKRQERA